jgi:hypothetical protein
VCGHLLTKPRSPDDDGGRATSSTLDGVASARLNTSKPPAEGAAARARIAHEKGVYLAVPPLPSLLIVE